MVTNLASFIKQHKEFTELSSSKKKMLEQSSWQKRFSFRHSVFSLLPSVFMSWIFLSLLCRIFFLQRMSVDSRKFFHWKKIKWRNWNPKNPFFIIFFCQSLLGLHFFWIFYTFSSLALLVFQRGSPQHEQYIKKYKRGHNHNRVVPLPLYALSVSSETLA